MKQYLQSIVRDATPLQWSLALLAVGLTAWIAVSPEVGLMVAAIGSPTVIVGTRPRTAPSTNREDTDYEMGIALLDPFQNPVTFMTMDMGRDTADTIDFHWFEDEMVPERSATTATTTTGGTTLTFASGTGDRYAIGDLVRHEATDEVMLVTASTTTTVGVTRDFGASTESITTLADTVALGDFIMVIGNAFEQGHPLPVVRSTKDIQYDNYCQDERTPVAMSEVAQNAKWRGEDDWPFQKRKAGIWHQRKLEFQGIWGRPYVGDKGQFVTSNTNPTASGGINHFIQQHGLTNQKLDEDEITQDEFQNFMEFVFEYGSGLKFCYCPPALRTALDKWGISKLNTFTSDTVFGMAVAKWLSSHGEIVFITHRMLKFRNSTSDYYYSFFMDMDELRWKTYRNIGSTRWRPLNVYEATGETSTKGEFQTIGGIKFGQPPHHARLRHKTAA